MSWRRFGSGSAGHPHQVLTFSHHSGSWRLGGTPPPGSAGEVRGSGPPGMLQALRQGSRDDLVSLAVDMRIQCIVIEVGEQRRAVTEFLLKRSRAGEPRS